MSQEIFTNINPLTTSGLMLSALLDDFKDALMTGCSGTSRPAQLQAGGLWVDTTSQAAPDYYWAFKIYDGSVDTEIFRISIVNGIGGTLTADSSFTIQKIAADTSGAVLELIKNRIVNNAQVLSGDTVAEVRFTGRTSSGTDPVVGYLKFTATDNMTSSVSGGTFSLYSTADASSTVSEHLKFIDGIVETVVPHKINSLKLVSQDVATTATIVQLSASKGMVEMTGATVTAIQGINSGHASKVVSIHNRSTAEVTLKHQNVSAAAADRIELPGNSDHVIVPQGTTTLFYCTTDLRWKLQEVTSKKVTKVVESFSNLLNTWVAPVGVSKIKVVTKHAGNTRFIGSNFIDTFGNMYRWGNNNQGQVGDGTIVGKSSPVAVLGGIKFSPNVTLAFGTNYFLGIGTNGQAYGWGDNDAGILGVGDSVSRSSPVAVVGSVGTFAHIYRNSGSSFGLTENGKLYAWGSNIDYALGDGTDVFKASPVEVATTLRFSRLSMGYHFTGGSNIALTSSGAAYAWGDNNSGQLGVGDLVRRSSPVAVLGGLTFTKVIMQIPSGGSGASCFGLTTSGAMYAWGWNGSGELGLGDVDNRSSPVAVLGGLTFKDFFTDDHYGTSGVFAITEDGTAYSWGDSTGGKLGLGDLIPRSSPVLVLGGLKFKRIEILAYAVVGRTTGDLLYYWGADQDGTLDPFGATSRSSPIAVPGGVECSWVRMIDSNAVLFSGPSGNLYSWGTNTQGQLGVGGNASRSTPTLVIGNSGTVMGDTISSLAIEVTPGDSYTILLSDAMSKFGDTPLGLGVDNITIEYDI